MKISARMYARDNQGGVKARGSICIEDAIVIDGVRVVEGKNGLFVAMPSRQKQDGSYADVAFPITKEAREQITAVVIDAYEKAKTTGKD